MAQVTGAAVVSIGLTLDDGDREMKLMALAFGRAILCASSALKFVYDHQNAAAVIWAILMLWTTCDNLYVLSKLRRSKFA